MAMGSGKDSNRVSGLHALTDLRAAIEAKDYWETGHRYSSVGEERMIIVPVYVYVTDDVPEGARGYARFD
jgi:hypothetical protein